MTIDFTRKHVIISIVSVMLFVGICISGYVVFLQPEKKILDQRQADLQMVQEELTIVENRLRQMEEQTVVSSTELQKQLPVKPFIEQLLLDIDKAELLSNSKVLQLKIGSTAEEVAFPDNQEGDAKSREATENKAATDETDKNKEETEFLPQGMKMVKVNIDAVADDYFEVEKFIDVLQTLQRIVRIDGVKFTGQKEITAIEDEYSPIPFEIILSAYYYPPLTDLADELPKLDTPAPSEKRNPFVHFADIELASIENRRAAKKLVEADGRTVDPARKSIEHLVRPGETLSEISMKYFGSRAGEQKIKDANGLTSHIVISGKTLKIPVNDK